MADPIRLSRSGHLNKEGMGVLRQTFIPPYTTPLHSHMFYELELTLSGDGEEFINGVTHQKKRGSVSLSTPADFHSFVLSSVTTVINVMFDEKYLPGGITAQLFAKDSDRFVMLSEEKTLALENLFNALSRTKDCDIPLNDTLLRKITEAALLIIMQESDMQKHMVKPKKQSDIQKLLQYIDLHFIDNPDVGTVAETIGKTPDYFSKYFKKHTGCGYNEYLNKRKTECAKALLEISNMTITEICFNSGFNSLSNFSRVFKDSTGKTPSEYRALHQKTSRAL